MMTDIEIAQSTPLCPIAEIAAKAGIPATAAEPYGSNKAKITEDFLRQREGKPQGKLILVTAVNPTPAGEGKTTTSIGLAQALCRLGKNAIVTLREPSLGPVFGLKGGAAGGGYSQVLPMEEINLHFTGDIHAVTAANNLLSALIDNHIHQGNALRLDPERIVFRRCMDMNDRSLRKIEIGLGGKANGTPRFDGFQISVASEVMAILCLAKDLKDLRERLGRILVGYTVEGKPVFAHDLQAEGAMAALLREALRPNLVQTLEHEAEAEVIEVVPCKAEPTVRTTVFAGLPKGERSDFLVQKCTEAGAAEIVFFSCTRCVAKAVNMEKKLERWQRISEEAAKQSGRGIIPQVRYEADFVAVLNGALHTDLPLFMYETGERETIRDAIEHTAQPIASAAIITGPEGGFAEFEADMARKLGMHICSMGERILRCETAPVVALTALMYGTGNL